MNEHLRSPDGGCRLCGPVGCRRFLAVGAVVCSLALAFGSASGETSGNRQLMADAMSKMMEAMGFLGSSAGVGNPMSGAGMPSPFGMPGWGMGGMPNMPNMGTGVGQLDQYGRMGQEWMDRFSRQVPGMSEMPWTASPLEGVWEGAGGGLLIVQGGYYRLYSAGGSFVDGHIEVSGQQLRMWSPRAGFDLSFELAEDQGRLALRDQNGQVYLYRRLVLDGGGA